MKWPRLRDPAAAEQTAPDEAARAAPSEPPAEESPAAFLSRWSRRKQAVMRGDASHKPALDADEPCPEPPAPGPGVSERPPTGLPRRSGHPPREGEGSERPAARADGVGLEPDAHDVFADDQEPLPPLPEIEEITAETDVAVFLRKGVPDALRNAALRKMWSLDPAIRDHVGDARDYAFDWNSPGGVPGFGAIEPGFDIEGTLSAMFSRAEPEAVAEDGAATPEADPPEVDRGPEAPAVAAAPAAAAQSVTSASASGPAEPGERQDAAESGSPPQQRAALRHGGATPW